ncbi:MAG: glycosyltransferase family 39 protein [Candidatus Krumholzibacteriia bacterium]
MRSRKRAQSAWVPDPAWLHPERAAQDREEISPGFLLLVTLLAAAVRIYHLGWQPLWVDEGMTWDMIRPDAGLLFGRQLLDEIQGPLYLAAVWPLAREFGLSEFWLRAPAALAGLLAVPLAGLLGRRLCGARTGRLLALLLAVSPFHLWYSQEARGYSFLILFAIVSTLAFLRLAEAPGGGRVLGYALAAAAMAWSNLSGLFLIGAQAVTAVVVVRPRGARARWLWTAAFALALLGALPWLLRASGILAVDRLVPGAAGGAALRGETTFTPLALPFTLFAFLFGYSLGPSLTELHQADRVAILRAYWPVLVAAAAASGVVLAAGLARLGRRTGVLLAIWIVLPVAAISLLAVKNVKPFNPRYLAATFPLVLLIAARGLGGVPRRLGRAGGFLLCGLCLWSLWGYYHDPRYAKEDVRDAAAWVAGRAEPGEPVIVPVITRIWSLYYQGPGRVVPMWETAPATDAATARAYLAQRLAGASHGFLVLARAWDIDPDGRLPAALAAETRIVAEARFPGVRVLEWRRDAAGAERRP